MQGNDPSSVAGYAGVVEVTLALKASMTKQGTASNNTFLAVLDMLTPLQQVPSPFPLLPAPCLSCLGADFRHGYFTRQSTHSAMSMHPQAQTPSHFSLDVV